MSRSRVLAPPDRKMTSRTSSAPAIVLRLDAAAPRRDVVGEDRELRVSDADLVRRAWDGDEWAEAAIYRRYAMRVANLAARLLGDRADAMDVLQDVFMEALSELHTLRDPGALRAWLLRRTVNKVHKRFRRRKLRRLLGLDRGAGELQLDALAAAGCSPEDHAELARVSSVLATLPPRQRTAWVLHRVEGETLPAVAEACAVSLATAKRDVAAAQAAIDAQMLEEPR